MTREEAKRRAKELVYGPVRLQSWEALAETIAAALLAAHTQGISKARAAAVGAEAELRRFLELAESEVTHDYYVHCARGARDAVQAIDFLSSEEPTP